MVVVMIDDDDDDDYYCDLNDDSNEFNGIDKLNDSITDISNCQLN